MADPTAIANPQVVFAQNWDSIPSNSCAYETQIEQNLDGSEQRKGLRGKPVRRISTASLAFSEDQSAKLYKYLTQSANGDVYMPLYSDQTEVTAGFTGGTNLPCDTRYRRFAVGGKAMIVVLEGPNVSETIRVVTIQSLTDTAITTSGSMTGTVPVGALVFPVIESQLILGHNASLETDRVLTLASNLFERTNANTIPASIAAGTVPSGVGSLRGLPVLDMGFNWDDIQEGVLRKGSVTQVGLSNLATLYGDRATDTGSINFLTESREEAWRLIQFFDSCRGAGRPFWYPHRTAVGIPLSVASLSITVPDDVPLSEWTTRKLVSVWYTDGSVDVRIVSGAIASSGYSILTLNSALSDPTLSNIAYVSFASLARLASDEMVENWETTEVLRTSFEIQGLPFSGDPTCIGLDCEDGDCQGEDCDGPDDPGPDDPGPPYKPKDRCLAGSATVPMYYDLTQTWNSGREPIRGGDLVMPDTLYIEVKNGLVYDANHPYGQDISDELKEALFKTHELVYVGTADRSGKSRNPYHTRVSGASGTSFSGRSGGELVEDSPVWEAEVPYPVGEEDYTLTVRMYAEWVEQSDSTLGDSSFGAWGPIFCVWAFTDEIDMSYTDGATYSPFNNNTFTKEDPIIGGVYTSDADSVKWMHPQALFFAVCPTTWHSPLGYSYYSQIDRDSWRVPCFAVNSGAPWSGGTATEARLNNVFGSGVGSYRMRALGSLGGWTKSEFYNWACIENGAGAGKTILKPTNAGWDEGVGDLTLSCDIRMDVCTPPQTAINPCEGHPDDPYQDIGGTHEAFRDNTPADDLSRLCYGTGDTSSLSTDQRCIVTTTVYAGGCDIVQRDCQEFSFNTVFTLDVDDYFFGTSDANTANRHMNWLFMSDDPEYVRQDFPSDDLCAIQSDCWSVGVGSGVISSESITYTVTGGKSVGYVSRYVVPASDEVVDGTISCTTTRTGSQRIGLGHRVAISGGSIADGYVAEVNESANTLKIYQVTGLDTISLLGTQSVTVPSGDYTLSFAARGSRLTASISGSVSASLTVENCDTDLTGNPAIVGFNANGSVNTIAVSDNNWRKLSATGRVQGKAELRAEFELEMTKGWLATQGGSCQEGCEPEDCPGDGCPCTSICKELSYLTAADSSGFGA